MWNLGLQDSFSPVAFHISSFHDLAMVIVIFIISVILYITTLTSLLKEVGRSMKSNETLETLWTVLPGLVLTALAAPSLVTLYMSEETPSSPALSVKIIGHQWYWSYEYGNSSSLVFDSYMIPSESLDNGDFRLLECDTRSPIPMGVEVQLMVTSGDVIHSWAVPSLGVKMDAIPGRLNQVSLFCSRPGVIYGQCSEICGSLHSFMPICLEIVPLEEFISFYNSMQ